jgi:hypothetical protein
MSNNQQLVNEGLRPFDLSELVDSLFEIDSYRSKMGEDQDVCVLTFRVKDRAPARDLMEFIEKGYDFVLDSDVSSGENDRGEYFVFVELPRSPKLIEQIKDIAYGVRRLTGISEWKFKYYKDKDVKELSEESLRKTLPLTSEKYQQSMNIFRTEDIKKFFNKTLMDDLQLEDDIITIYKPFGKTISLKIVKEDTSDKILEGIEEPPVVDNNAMGEIFWLTKVLGDYNINKIGNGFVFENGDKAMLLQRIEL